MEHRNRFVMLAVGTIVAVLGTIGQAGAQTKETKEARGTISAVAERSVTVKVGAQDLTFFVDHETYLEVRKEAKDLQQAKAPSGKPNVNDYFEPGNVVL